MKHFDRDRFEQELECARAVSAVATPEQVSDLDFDIFAAMAAEPEEDERAEVQPQPNSGPCTEQASRHPRGTLSITAGTALGWGRGLP